MGLEVGEVNPKVFAVLGVLAVMAGGYMWYSKMYTPAVASLAAAQSAMQTSAQTLDGNKKKLDAMKVAATDKPKTDDPKAMAEIAVAKLAFPRGKQTLTALQQIETIAAKSDVVITKESPPVPAADGSTDPAAASASQTAVPQTITLQGHSTYASLGVMLRHIQETATVYHGKLYIPDRMLETTSLTIGTSTSDSSSSGGGDGAGNFTGSAGTTAPVIPKDHIPFTITIVYYADLSGTTDTSATPATGATGTPATGSPATGAPADGTAASSSSTAAGTGGATNGTTPAAGGAASTTSGGAAPSGGGASTSSPNTSDTPPSTG